MKYYFYYYRNELHSKCDREFNNALIKGIHPYKHIHNLNMKGEFLLLISWQEITEDEYNEFMKLDE